MSILNKPISLFRNALITRPETTNLLDWLNGIHEHSFLVDQIRASDNKYQRDQFKKQLPAITPSGTFHKRSKSGLLLHSGLIAFDIDNVGDNTGDIKAAITHIPNVAYCGISVSGNGLWGLIPISDPTKHEAHFRAIEIAFSSIGIIIDPSCKDVSRLRFYSYDKEAYFNHEAVIFEYQYIDPPIKARVFMGGSNDRIIYRACKLIQDAPDGQKYFNLNKASYLLGGYIGAGKINEAEAREALRAAISMRECADLGAAYKTIDIGLKDGMLKPVQL